MALLGDFRQTSSDRNQLHGPVEWGWRAFEVEGRKILQIDTYGSQQRKLTGKQSQSIQVDERAAQILTELIRETFPSLRPD